MEIILNGNIETPVKTTLAHVKEIPKKNTKDCFEDCCLKRSMQKSREQEIFIQEIFVECDARKRVLQNRKNNQRIIKNYQQEVFQRQQNNQKCKLKRVS